MGSPEKYTTGELDKLVRDKIPQRIKGSGLIPVTHIAHGVEYTVRLQKKLKEEVSELLLAQSKEQVEEEIGDIIEVLHSYVQLAGTEMKMVESRRQAKHTTHGGFATGIVLDRVEKP